MSLENLKEHDDYVDEGRTAALAGCPIKENPYDIGDLDWCAWREGWRAASSKQ